jgi:hypothetical protein
MVSNNVILSEGPQSGPESKDLGGGARSRRPSPHPDSSSGLEALLRMTDGADSSSLRMTVGSDAITRVETSRDEFTQRRSEEWLKKR